MQIQKRKSPIFTKIYLWFEIHTIFRSWAEDELKRSEIEKSGTKRGDESSTNFPRYAASREDATVDDVNRPTFRSITACHDWQPLNGWPTVPSLLSVDCCAPVPDNRPISAFPPAAARPNDNPLSVIFHFCLVLPNAVRIRLKRSPWPSPSSSSLPASRSLERAERTPPPRHEFCPVEEWEKRRQKGGKNREEAACSVWNNSLSKVVADLPSRNHKVSERNRRERERERERN